MFTHLIGNEPYEWHMPYNVITGNRSTTSTLTYDYVVRADNVANTYMVSTPLAKNEIICQQYARAAGRRDHREMKRLEKLIAHYK